MKLQALLMTGTRSLVRSASPLALLLRKGVRNRHVILLAIFWSFSGSFHESAFQGPGFGILDTTQSIDLDERSQTFPAVCV